MPHLKSKTSNAEDDSIQAVQFRIARPTTRLNQVVSFYNKGLGLKVLGSFKGHSGYDGVMLGLPGTSHHLEFTQQDGLTSLPAPTKENLLVLYFDSQQKYREANERLESLDIWPVEPENPYWKGRSETYEDPDGWRVVLFNGVYKP